jgi:hypothetical protein
MAIGTNIVPQPSHLGSTIISMTQQQHCAMVNVVMAAPLPA